MCIFEDINTVSACININLTLLNSAIEQDNKEEAYQLLSRIKSNNDTLVESINRLVNSTKDIYSIIKGIYPVEMSDTLDMYHQGIKDAHNLGVLLSNI